jgi:hypothetical protein
MRYALISLDGATCENVFFARDDKLAERYRASGRTVVELTDRQAASPGDAFTPPDTFTPVPATPSIDPRELAVDLATVALPPDRNATQLQLNTFTELWAAILRKVRGG